MTVKHLVNNIVLYAVNTGKWYAEHCEASKYGTAPSVGAAQYLRFATRAERRYAREFPDEQRLSAAELLQVAVKLEEYYREHVEEGIYTTEGGGRDEPETCENPDCWCHEEEKNSG